MTQTGEAKSRDRRLEQAAAILRNVALELDKQAPSTKRLALLVTKVGDATQLLTSLYVEWSDT